MIYEFDCVQCNRIFEEFRKAGDFEPAKCSKCGNKAKKIISRPGPPDYGFKPYVSEQLNPEPHGSVYIDSRATKDKLMKKYGLQEAGTSYGKHRRDGVPLKGDL